MKHKLTRIITRLPRSISRLLPILALILVALLLLETKIYSFHQRSALSKRKQGECKPPSKIYYLKIHKTGSTTFFNVINRYAIRKDLRMATYGLRPYEGGHKERIDDFMIPKYVPGKSPQYDIISDHSMYIPEEIRNVLGPDYISVTFLRNPTTYLRSYIEHYKLGDRKGLYGQGDVALALKKYVQRYDMHGAFVKATTNIAAKYFGFNGDVPEGGKGDMAGFYKHIKDTFIVGVTEYFTESLIMIRRKLCLDWRDILVFKLRSREKESKDKSSGTRRVPAQVRNTDWVCSRSPVDCQLYMTFNATLWKYIHDEGPEFMDEVSAFQTVIRDASSYCDTIQKQLRSIKSTKEKREIWQMKPLYVKATKYSNEFTVSPTTCALMQLEERAFANYFYLKQNWHECDIYKRKPRLRCPSYDFLVRHLNCSRVCQLSDSQEKLLPNILSEPDIFIN